MHIPSVACTFLRHTHSLCRTYVLTRIPIARTFPPPNLDLHRPHARSVCRIRSFRPVQTASRQPGPICLSLPRGFLQGADSLGPSCLHFNLSDFVSSAKPVDFIGLTDGRTFQPENLGELLSTATELLIMTAKLLCTATELLIMAAELLCTATELLIMQLAF